MQYQSSYSLLRIEPTVEYNGGGGNLVRRAQSIKTTQLKCLFTETVTQTDEDVFSGTVSSVENCPCSIQGCVCVCVVCVCVCVSLSSEQEDKVTSLTRSDEQSPPCTNTHRRTLSRPLPQRKR